MWQFLVSSWFWCRIVSLTTLTQGRTYIIPQLISSRVSFLLNLIMKDLTCKWNVKGNVTKFQARIHIGFHRFAEIGQIFHNIFFNEEKMFQVGRLHPRRMKLANILFEWLRNPGKGTLGSWKLKNFLGEHSTGFPWKIAASALVQFRKSVNNYPRSAPTNNFLKVFRLIKICKNLSTYPSPQKKNWLTRVGRWYFTQCVRCAIRKIAIDNRGTLSNSLIHQP